MTTSAAAAPTSVIARGYRSARKHARQMAVGFCFTIMERLLPTDRSLWCFAAWDRHWHTLDNPRAVFERVKDDASVRKVVLTRGSVPAGWADGVNVEFVHAESLRGLYCIARSAVIVLGYSLFVLCSYGRLITRKHRLVQVWHGIPLKRIGHLFPGEHWWHDETPRYAATVCSSERDREIMRQAFAPLPADRVWLTGLPRNDFIVGPAEALPPDYRAMLEAVQRQLDGRRLVLYAPTWREAAASHYAFSEAEVARLEELLGRHNAVLGVRGHSNVRGNAAYTRQFESERLLSLNDLPDVNVILRVTDVLVTDYSSIYIDFLLTDRPVLHFAYDLASYEGERGFLYDLAEAFAAPPALDFEQLLVQLESALTHPVEHSTQRAAARALFHNHAADSGRAVADRIRSMLVNEAAA